MKPAMKIACLAVLPVLAIGCVSRSTYDAATKQTETCEQEKTSALKIANDCQASLASEGRRWNSIEAQLTTTLPQTLRDFQDERTKIIQLVPAEVRKEVGGRLDRYFAGLSKEFERMDGKLEELRHELSASRGQVADLATTTRSVDTKVDAANEALKARDSQMSKRLDDQAARVLDAASLVIDFDSKRINCEDCDDRIKLKGDGKEHLLAFHASLVKKLQAVGRQDAVPADE